MKVTAKDLLIDFLNLVFLVVLVGFVLSFFIVGDRFGVFIKIMRSLIPIAVFLIIFLIMLKIKRMAFKEKQTGEMNEEKTVLYLGRFDLLKWDIVIFLLPVIILLLAFFIDKEVTITDIIQATIALLLMYHWKKLLLNKGDIY